MVLECQFKVSWNCIQELNRVSIWNWIPEKLFVLRYALGVPLDGMNRGVWEETWHRFLSSRSEKTQAWTQEGALGVGEAAAPPLLEKRDSLLHQFIRLTLHVTQRQRHWRISRGLSLSLYMSSLPRGQVAWRHRLNCLLETDILYNCFEVTNAGWDRKHRNKEWKDYFGGGRKRRRR